jgi:predicted molibdopterin-dependent oxidoreductase YjgC
VDVHFLQRLHRVLPLEHPDHRSPDVSHQGGIASFCLGKFFALDFKEPNELPNEEYPFLTTGRLMFHFHTGLMTRRSKKLDSEVPEAYVEINVTDASKIELNGHKRVRVTSRRGQIHLGVRVTDDIKRGTVFIPFHFAEAAANKLTHSAIDPVAKIPEYKVSAVEVEVA